MDAVLTLLFVCDVVCALRPEGWRFRFVVVGVDFMIRGPLGLRKPLPRLRVGAAAAAAAAVYKRSTAVPTTQTAALMNETWRIHVYRA